MLVFKKTKDLQDYLRPKKAKGVTVGFVPTMGALHKGHLSLVKRSKGENDVTVTSIFVNPTQFNDPSDLANYPRTTDTDLEELIAYQNDIVFLPEVDEVYPESLEEGNEFDFGYLDKPMEGRFRPGHFTGVAQVVSKLLDMVAPRRLYLGQKDYQQYRIISEMIRQQGRDVESVLCDTVREEDGLALSSRNKRLSERDRKDALIISQTLFGIQERARKGETLSNVKQWAESNLYSNPNVEPEYLEIIDAASFKAVTSWDDAHHIIAFAAARVGPVRLIDNVIIF